MSTASISSTDSAHAQTEYTHFLPEDVEFITKYWDVETRANPAVAEMSAEEYFHHFEEICSRCCSPEELGLDCNENDFLCRSRQCAHLKPMTDREVGEMLDSLEQGLKDGSISLDMFGTSPSELP